MGEELIATEASGVLLQSLQGILSTINKFLRLQEFPSIVVALLWEYLYEGWCLKLAGLNSLFFCI